MSWSNSKKAVLVPFDFSDAAGEALQVALSFAETTKDVDVVYVMTPPTAPAPGVIWGELDIEGIREQARKSLSEALSARGAGDCTTHVLIGSPATRLVDFARDRGTDLVVIASHGRTGLGRWMMGSVAERVVRMAPCPVLVLRREDD